MPERVKRRYNSPHRQGKAAATHAAIAAAARRLFAERGYRATTIEAIAAEAGLSVQTVYFAFGSKAAILSSLVAATGGDPRIRRQAASAMAEFDPQKRLALAARVVASIMEADIDIVSLLWQAGSGDAQLLAVWRQGHQQQLGRLAEVLQPIANAGRLRSGLTPVAATDMYFALCSPEVYRLLVVERGWTNSRYQRWLAETSAAMLMDSESSRT